MPQSGMTAYFSRLSNVVVRAAGLA